MSGPTTSCTGRLEVHLQDAPNPGVAFTTFDGHVYMYSSTRRVREFSTDAPAQSARLASDPKSKTPPWEEWALYDGVKPGYFYTDDLFAVRRSLLESGRSPKVSLKDLHTPTALRYQCTRRGGVRSLSDLGTLSRCPYQWRTLVFV